MENINKQKGSKELWAIIVTILILFLFLLHSSTKKDIARLQKYDICLTEAITAVPDPNETEGRVELLKGCMDN